MHYAPTAFSKNGQPTIVAKGSGGSLFGTTEEPTETDLYELNVAYQCKTEVEEETKNEPDTYDGSGFDYEPEVDEEIDNEPDTDEGSGFEDVSSIVYEDYENVYADYGDITSVIDLINTQYGR